MADSFTFYEMPDSGAGSIGERGDVVKKYFFSGSDDESEVAAFAAINVPTTWNDYPYIGIGWDRTAPGAIGSWIVSVTYRDPSAVRQTGDAVFSFTIGSATVHITHAVAQIGSAWQTTYTVSDYTAPDLKGAINVTEEGIGGLDIEGSTFDFKITSYVAAEDMTESYLQSLYAAKLAPVNSDTVTIDVDGVTLTFNPGELRLRDAEGSKRHGYGDWEFTLSFSGSPNVTSAQCGDISGIDKDGWDYLWVHSEPTLDSNSNQVVPQPKYVAVDRVYNRSALSGLIPAAFSGSSAPWTDFGT